MGNAQPVQGDGIQGDFIGSLRHPAGGGGGEAMFRVTAAGPADLYLAAGQAVIFRQAQDNALPHFPDVRMGGQFFRIFRRNAFERRLGVVARLAEGHFDEVFAHALGQGKEGGEHKGGHDNGQRRRQVAALVFAEGALVQGADRVPFFLCIHDIRPLTEKQCGHPRCG